MRLYLSILMCTILIGLVVAQDENNAYQIALDRIQEAQAIGASELDLSSIGLTDFPSEIASLGNLRVLNLNNNALSSLPAEIGNLGNLQILYLANNRFSSLPAEIGNLGSLEELGLAYNQLSNLPPEIGNLGNLQRLYLFGNRLESLPASIGSLSRLYQLGLGSNRLISLPPEIGHLGNLRALWLPGNQLASLPAEIATLSSLEILDLASNQLTQLPPEIGDLPNLCVLNLDWNQIQALPNELGLVQGLASLSHCGLYLVGNPLSYPPQEIRDQGTATILDYLRNEIETTSSSANIDTQTGNQAYQTALERIQAVQESGATHLSLNDMGLTELPAEIGSLNRLQVLSIHNNQLTSLPEEFGQLANLQVLSLGGNLFTEFPLEIADLTNLHGLSLRNNQLSELPSEIGNLVNLQELYLDTNHLSDLPSEMANLNQLCYLNLSNNQFEYLPLVLTQLTGLRNTDCDSELQAGLYVDGNPLLAPPQEVIEQGTVAILDYLLSQVVSPDSSTNPISTATVIAVTEVSPQTPYPIICEDSPPSRLTVGDLASVTISQEGEVREDLRVRSEPNGERIGAMAEGTQFRIVGGPRCANGLTWWQIETLDGELQGWSAEGLAPDDYFIQPIH